MITLSIIGCEIFRSEERVVLVKIVTSILIPNYSSSAPLDLSHSLHEMLCTIWYNLYNFKNVQNTHGGVSLLVKFDVKACNFTKNNTPP